MDFDVNQWTYFEIEGSPIYVRPDQPNWMAPNQAGHALLRRLKNGDTHLDLPERLFLERLKETPATPYEGRGTVLKTDKLSELWFHITNRCNLNCRHCLVCSGPQETTELSKEQILTIARQGVDLGGRVFALTGGEPLLHRDFAAIVEGLLSFPDTNVVVLTNGLLLRGNQPLLRQWPVERFHLQISLDGMQPHHDAIRGPGTFEQLSSQLAFLKESNVPFTLSMCVVKENVDDMPRVVPFAKKVGASNVHFLWYFLRGRAKKDQWVDLDVLFERYKDAVVQAEEADIGIDNIEALKTQIFAPAGTKHDGSSAGWQSLAIGPDGMVYPTPAMVGVEKLAAPMAANLNSAWRNSYTLQELRSATAKDSASPLRFLLGGGDSDHSYVYGSTFTGSDPYEPLQQKMALWLIAREASRQPEKDKPELRLKMGDILESCGTHGPVSLVHNNCLLAVAGVDGRTAVKDFYGKAAEKTNQDILNPICFPEELIAHIPQAFRFRGYGCGSPVQDAAIQPGETVVDLGCGAGVECFIAARQTGPHGRVIGIDMLESMLSRARTGGRAVTEQLGYDNLEFREGYLETLPLADHSADVILSNCVINLSTHKRNTFREILRVLKPGGRLVVSDVVCEDDPGPDIRNDDTLRGECLAGALTQHDLFGLLAESGFEHARALKRFPYRVVREHPFYSMTFQALKPLAGERLNVMYRGPLAAMIASDGTLLPAGQTRNLSATIARQTNGELFCFDRAGNIVNMELDSSCCCGTVTEGQPKTTDTMENSGCCSPAPTQSAQEQVSSACSCGPESTESKPAQSDIQTIDCMVCGSPLAYLAADEERTCDRCGEKHLANVVCEQGHFVCDGCHSRNALEIIERVCRTSSETDMIALMNTIRGHKIFPMHGPEHHAMVPGIILAVYRNLGGMVTDEMILTAIRRGSKISGGACAFWGGCGGALGVGSAFSVILESSPFKGDIRQTVMKAANAALEKIAGMQAPRCCQRDCYLALKAAAELSRNYLPIPLRADAVLVCDQLAENPHCMGQTCPIHPLGLKQTTSGEPTETSTQVKP